MSSERKFSIGSIVKLLSGGPVMTINDIDLKTSFMKCVWFSNGNCVSEFSFCPDALRNVYEWENPCIPPADYGGINCDQVM